MLDQLLGMEEGDGLMQLKGVGEEVKYLELENYWQFSAGTCYLEATQVTSQHLHPSTIVPTQTNNILSNLLSSLSLPNFFECLPKLHTCLFISTLRVQFVSISSLSTLKMTHMSMSLKKYKHGTQGPL